MKKSTQALLAVIIGNSIFGFSFLFSKIALQYTVPTVLIAVRFTVAFLVLHLVVMIGKRLNYFSFSLKGKPKRDIVIMVICQPLIYFIAENYGIVFTSSAFSGIIIALVPIAGILCDIMIMHAKVNVLQIVCALISIVGVFFTTIGATDMNSSLKGVIVLLIAVVAGALFYAFSKRAGVNYNPLERTYVMFATGSVVYSILALIQCRNDYDKLIIGPFMQGAFWQSIVYLSIVSSVIAFLLLHFSSNYISVSQATIFANLTTVISIIAGIMILHENFTWQQGMGAALILISVTAATLSNRPKQVR